MTCSVISVLCIRPRLIYREPRRGTGCAPGAHPGPSHASALPPILSPTPSLIWLRLFPSVPLRSCLPPFDLGGEEGKSAAALPFLLFVPRRFFLILSSSFEARILGLLSTSLFVYLILNGAFEVNIVPPIGSLSLARTFLDSANIFDRRNVTRYTQFCLFKAVFP